MRTGTRWMAAWAAFGMVACGDGTSEGTAEAPATSVAEASLPPDAHPAKAERRSVRLQVAMDPLPAELGGNLFYAGFESIDPETGRPDQGARPMDHGIIARWVGEFPVQTDVELVPGLDYLVMYSMESYARPEDRVAPGQHFSGETSLTYTIPARPDLPPGGVTPSTERAYAGGPG